MVPSQKHKKRQHWYALAVPLRSNEGTCIYLRLQPSHPAVAGWTSQACLASQCWPLLQPKQPGTRVATREAKPCLELTMANEKRLQSQEQVSSAIRRESWTIDLTWMKRYRDLRISGRNGWTIYAGSIMAPLFHFWNRKLSSQAQVRSFVLCAIDGSLSELRSSDI